MKDYEVTKIWATEIAEISQMIDDKIAYKRSLIATMETEERCEYSWYQEQIDELKEKIKTAEWVLNQINAPFKLKK